MDSPSMWAPVVSTLVGGALAIGGGFLAKLYSDRQERLSLKSAHAGELRAYLDLLERQDYLHNLSEHIQSMKENPGTFSFFSVWTESSAYRTIFTSTASRIGMLPAPLPEQLVRHYLIGSIFNYLELIRDADQNPVSNNWIRQDPDQCLRVHEELLERMKSARSMGSDLINKLEGV